VRRPPQWTEFIHYPATAGTWLLAAGLTAAWWMGVDMTVLLEDPSIAHGQIWRLVTSTLLHANILHLAFNVFALWAFGTIVEDRFGSLNCLLIFLYLAVGSNAAEFAFLEGGVGLSGVVYGLFGLLWVLAKKDHSLADAVDAQTTAIVVGWFFFCIFLTVTGAMPIANIAHGVGAILGALLGWAISTDRKIGRMTVAGAALVLLLSGALFARPYLNFSKDAGLEEAYRGYEALQQDKNEEAVRWFKEATKAAPKHAKAWFNLAVAESRLDHFSEAADAYDHAARLEPGNAKYKEASDAMKQYVESLKLLKPPS
jgi:membrane associated rhomboid family serine protease